MISPDTPILMIDTETTNSLDDPLVYDVGYQIFTLAQGTLCEKSFLNADIFLDSDFMESAHFKEKIPNYWKEIQSRQRILKRWKNIKKALVRDCYQYNIEIACAHNAIFDNRAINTTQRYITSSKYRYVLPFGVVWWDTLKMARMLLKDNLEYGNFCLENGYVTKNNKPRFTAEIIYRWLSDDSNFIESHTGLEDVKIERKIFEFCISANPEIDGRLWKN